MAEIRDFFISFTWADEPIAAAINGALRDAGFTTWFHPTDKPLGAGIADWMEVALDASTQMLAICSDAYFDREKGYSRAERQSMFWEDPTNNKPLLILVKVAECKFPRLITQNEYIDLLGMQRPEAAAKLVAELKGEQARKARIAASQVNRSRAHPKFFNVQGGKNPLFTGRDAELDMLHERIKSGTATAITAVQGMGGIGKTSLAREYAHRFGTAARFGGVWWIDAETQSGIFTAFEQLAEKLGDEIARDADQEKTAHAVRDWLGQQPDNAPWLVIFDNAPNDEAIAPWLPKGSARTIITTRYNGFETIAELLRLDTWDRETTAEFLQKRTKRGTNEEALSLADRLDGLPLAAEQAGAFLHQNAALSFKSYKDRLVEMLGRAPKNLPDGYNKSLYATFRTALEAIAEREHGEAASGLLNLCAFLSPDGVELKFLKDCAGDLDILPQPLRDTLKDEFLCAEAVSALSDYALIRVGDVPDWGQTIIMHRLLGDIARHAMGEDNYILWSQAAVGNICDLMPSDALDPSAWSICTRLAPHVQAMLTLKPEPVALGEKLAYALNQVAVYLYARGDFDGAIALFRKCIKINEIIYRNDPIKMTPTLGNLAGHLVEREETRDEAEALYMKALKIKEEKLAPDNPLIAITLSNLGGLYGRQKKFPSAIEFTERAADIDKNAFGENSTQYATDLNNLGVIYSQWAKAENSPALHRKASEAKEKSSQFTRALRGMRHPEMTVMYGNLAVMHANAEDRDQAANHMELCVAIELSLDQWGHPDTRTEIDHLIHYWSESNQSDKADRLLAGDISDLVPIVEQIEEDHRAWLAEDPEHRKFGPRSPVTGATE